MTDHSPSCRGHFSRNASGQLTYELHHVPADHYRSVCELVRRQFHLAASGEIAVDVLGDEAFQEFSSKAGAVSLEWDIWIGFTVVATNPESEPLTEAIGAFLGSSPAVDKHLHQE